MANTTKLAERVEILEKTLVAVINVLRGAGPAKIADRKTIDDFTASPGKPVPRVVGAKVLITDILCGWATVGHTHRFLDKREFRIGDPYLKVGDKAYVTEEHTLKRLPDKPKNVKAAKPVDEPDVEIEEEPEPEDEGEDELAGLIYEQPEPPPLFKTYDSATVTQVQAEAETYYHFFVPHTGVCVCGMNRKQFLATAPNPMLPSLSTFDWRSRLCPVRSEKRT